MTGLFRGLQTPDGRLVSTDQIFTYDGQPLERLARFDLEIGPDETVDDDEQEAA